MTIYNAYLIKGYLIDKKAPKRIMEALDTLIGGLHAVDGRTPDAPDNEVDGKEDVEPEPPQRVAMSQTTAPPEMAGSVISEQPTEFEPPEQPKPRRTSSMSPENREAARQRMIAMQARKRAEREGNPGSTPEPTPTKPYVPVTADKLIQDHGGYVGKRNAGQPLTPEDWPDIKARLATGEKPEAIAGDYDQEVDELNSFIAARRWRDEHPGE